jgi:hypothetical protein
LQTFYNRGLTNIFASVVLLVSTFIIMWQMDRKLTAASMTVIPFCLGSQALLEADPSTFDNDPNGARGSKYEFHQGSAGLWSRRRNGANIE